MGNKPEDLRITEEAPKVQPDFNFKFSEKTKLRLESDISSDSSVFAENAVASEDSIDGAVDKRFFEISIDRPTGIEFATDLSLRFLFCWDTHHHSCLPFWFPDENYTRKMSIPS